MLGFLIDPFCPITCAAQHIFLLQHSTQFAAYFSNMPFLFCVCVCVRVCICVEGSFNLWLGAFKVHKPRTYRGSCQQFKKVSFNSQTSNINFKKIVNKLDLYFADCRFKMKLNRSKKEKQINTSKHFYPGMT